MKNPLKKEYLNQYKKSAGGGYEFTGTYYVYAGENFRAQLLRIAALAVAITVAVIGSGCLSAGGMRNSFYVILPFIAEVSALFALLWSSVKLFSKGERVKEYIYKVTYPRLPRICIALAVCAGVSLICSVIFIILNGAEGGVAKCVIYNGLKAVIIALSLLYRALILKTTYVVR